MMEAEGRPLKKRRVSQSPVSAPNDTKAETRNTDVCNVPRLELDPVTDPASEEKIILSTPDSVGNGGVSILEDTADDAAVLNTPKDETFTEIPLSKNQLKKLKRQQEWEASRAARRVKRKTKIKEKQERKRTALGKIAIPRSPPADGRLEEGSPAQQREKRTHGRSVQLPITFVLDCGFDDLMLDKERVSLAAQLTRCYSDNHHAPFKAHMALCSFRGPLKERFDTVLSGHYQNWKGVRFLAEDFLEVAGQAKEWMVGDRGGTLSGAFALTDDSSTSVAANRTESGGEIIYLTSDSPDTLTALKPYSTYIIGGLVDRNRHKGICYKRALDRGVKTAKLPIGEYMDMTSRFVLATNHVVEIMLQWLELGDWGEAFLKVVPKRKGGVLKGGKGEGKDGGKGGDAKVDVDGDDSVKDDETVAEA